jgi:CheY-like chemotaxis protein
VRLVEDDPAVRSALLGALEVSGFEAMGAGDAAEALEALSQQRFHVVAADYHLPGITGLDLLAAIKEAEAREARRGLWADAHPVPPWEWRGRRGSSVSSPGGKLTH